MLVLVGAVTSHRFIWPLSVRCGIRAASSVAQAAILGALPTWLLAMASPLCKYRDSLCYTIREAIDYAKLLIVTFPAPLLRPFRLFVMLFSR